MLCILRCRFLIFSTDSVLLSIIVFFLMSLSCFVPLSHSLGLGHWDKCCSRLLINSSTAIDIGLYKIEWFSYRRLN